VRGLLFQAPHCASTLLSTLSSALLVVTRCFEGRHRRDESMAAPLEHLEIGSGVEVHGLKARPDLNAKHARVVAYVPERERYHVVILGTDEEVYLRRANLTRPAAAAAPATAFSYSLLSRGRSQPTSSESQPTSSESQPTSSESERRIGLAPISPDARNPRSKNFQDFKRKGCCVVLRKSTESLVHLSCSAFQYIVSFFPSTDHSL
jgi:hypothetical protein